MGRHFPVRENSGNFERTGKVREKSGKTTQNTGKLRAFHKKIICYFSMIFKGTVYYLLKCIKFLVRKNKTLKKYWKMEKNTGKVREFCQPGKVGTLNILCVSYWITAKVVSFQDAYFRLAKEYHPDSTSTMADAVKFTQIEESYRYLVVSGPHQRNPANSH